MKLVKYRNRGCGLSIFGGVRGGKALSYLIWLDHL